GQDVDGLRQGRWRLGRRQAPGPHIAHRGPEPVQEEEEAALMEWVETTGETVDEAKDLALDQLGVDEHDAEFEILEEPRTGLFGRRKGEARVRARVRPTQPRPKVDRRDRKGRAGRGRGNGGGRDRRRNGERAGNGQRAGNGRSKEPAAPASPAPPAAEA